MKPFPLTAAIVILAWAASGVSAGDLGWSDPAALGPPPAHAVGWPNRSAEFDALPGFADPPPGYGEVAFYWWLGDPLTRERLAWQLDRLHESQGVTGLQVNYAHSDRGGRSYGLTYPSRPPLFSEAWWELFRWFLAEGKKRGMAASLSDYTLGVPGQGWWVDEILKESPDLCGAVLHGEIRDVSAGAEISWTLPQSTLNLAAYRVKDGALEPGSGVDLRPKLSAGTLRWRAPEGMWKLVAVFSQRQPLSIDPMNPLSGSKVVEKFFGRFERQCPGEGGRGLNFFFSDELDFGVAGRLWNARFAEEFRKRKGYDLIPELPALFVDTGPRTPKLRLDYSDVLVALSEESYFRPLFQWHYERGMTYGCDHGGRGRNVVEFGDYFRTQRWMTGPGNDSPALSADVVKNKVASSIAHLYQRPRVWLEGYHSSGWGTSTSQLVDATYKNFIHGHNLLTLHGLYYSTHGGWWEWAPPCNHFRMPYWAHMREFFRCSQRLSYLLSQGVHRCDVAIVYPVAAVEAGMDGDAAVNAAFGLGTHLFNRGIDFDFLDFESLARARVERKELRVSGEAYRVLVLPAMRAVRHSTICRALDFWRAGGTVVGLGALPEASDRAGRGDAELEATVREIFAATAKDAASLREIQTNRNAAGGLAVLTQKPEQVEERIGKSLVRDFAVVSPGSPPGAAHPQVLHRRIGPRDVYMVLGAPKHSECFFRAKGKVELWDPWTGDVRPLYVVSETRDGTKVRMPREACEAQLIVFQPGTPALTVEQTDLDEVLGFAQKDGKIVLRGLAGPGGRKTAAVRSGHRTTILSGDAPATPPPVKLDGPWEFELVPTMDNRFGDFRWPPTPASLGAEARQFRYAEETSPDPGWQAPGLDDSRWAKVRCSFGPRFWKLGPLPQEADAAKLETRLAALAQLDPAAPVELGDKKYSWQPYSFSMRWGIEGDPGHEGYHGLKELVSDDFIALGKVSFTWTNSLYEKEEQGSRYYLWTTVPAGRESQAQVLRGGMKPSAVWLNGSRLEPLARKVQLKSGPNTLLLRYDGPGRGHFVLDTSGATDLQRDDDVFSPAASWIWYPHDAESVADRFFRKSFEVAEVPAKARLRITCDNAYTVYVNGQPVGRGSRWQSIEQYDVAKHIARGKNVIAVAAHNDGGPAGLIAELTLTGPNAQTIRLATDATWRCSPKEDHGWREAGFDDGRWARAEPISPFEESLWAQHPQGPPALVALDEPPRADQVSPLAMRWHNRPGIPPYDIRPQVARPAGWYRFRSPPGLRGMTIVAHGKVQAWADGKAMSITTDRDREDGSREYRAAVAQPAAGPVGVAVRVEQDRGCYGGAALPEPVILDCGPGTIALGDWSRIDGLASYSGGAWYRTRAALSREQAAGRIVLDLGSVNASAEVRVNGKPAGIKVAPPWKLDISKLVEPGENRIEVLVFNTLANHYSTIPTRYGGPLVSGLLGPVRIETSPPVVLEEKAP
jgi:hypothetical protein